MLCKFLLTSGYDVPRSRNWGKQALVGGFVFTWEGVWLCFTFALAVGARGFCFLHCRFWAPMFSFSLSKPSPLVGVRGPTWATTRPVPLLPSPRSTRWTAPPPHLPSHPIPQGHPSAPALSTVSCIKPGLAIYFIYNNIHSSILFSQIIPPSPSPTESKRLFYTSDRKSVV